MIVDITKRILIVGLGLLGGSYARGLKRFGFHISAITKEQSSIDFALKERIIDEGSTEIDARMIGEADLVIFALYPHIFVEWIAENQGLLKSGALITDVTGVKRSIVYKIQDILRPDVEFVAAHPMAGRERSGVEFSDASVFKGANYLITVTPKNSKENIELIEKIAYEMGFKNVKKVSPKYHDEMIAYTSQLPHALAVALINSDIEGRETGSFVGDSYKELTRIANINETLWSELFLGNKKNLLNSINNFQDELNKISKCLEDDDKESLEKLFIKSTKRRENL